MIKTYAPLILLTALLAGHQAAANTVAQANLTSDGKVTASFTDPNLVNPWGISYAPGGDFWVSDNATGLTTLYDGTGKPQSLVVTIPPPAGGHGPSAPTGQVYNAGPNFIVTESGKSGPAAFIFVTEDGTISGWSPTVDVENAVTAVDNSATKAVYKGIAIVPAGSATELMVTNFRSGFVEIYDGTFKLTGQFRDTGLPADYAPYNVAVLNNTIYVTYAKQNKAKHDSKSGVGFGYVDVVGADGTLVTRLVSKLGLNAPWGLALAPSSWGVDAGALLVGNFGDGSISLYNPSEGEFFGALATASGELIIKDLWAIVPGNGGAGGSASELYFTAGLAHEKHGLFGSLTYSP
jgi:uncharacterized protein (TIGR03118 family)